MQCIGTTPRLLQSLSTALFKEIWWIQWNLMNDVSWIESVYIIFSSDWWYGSLAIKASSGLNIVVGSLIQNTIVKRVLVSCSVEDCKDIQMHVCKEVE